MIEEGIDNATIIPVLLASNKLQLSIIVGDLTI